LNGKFYVGVHSTDDLDDGYFGSGKMLTRSVNKHGKDNHVMEILEFAENRESILRMESLIVDSNLLDNPLCLNLKLGGEGGWGPQSEESKQKISAARLGKPRSEETKQKIKESFAKKSKEEKNSLRTAVGRKHLPTKGTMWINDGKTAKLIKVHEDIPIGWSKGRK